MILFKESGGKITKGVTPRTDAEAMRIMAERKVIAPANKDDMPLNEIIEALANMPLHQRELAARLWSRVKSAMKIEAEQKQIAEEAKEQEKQAIIEAREKEGFKLTFKHLDVSDDGIE